MKMRKGFTLVELSIVLIIIGLLIGGVLKGREMIDNAKRKRVKSDIDSFVAAAYSYQDKYGYLPGDDKEDRSSELGATGCDGSNSDGNGRITNNDERSCFWQELAGAGLISGDPSDSGNTMPKHSPYGGAYYVSYYSADTWGLSRAGNCVRVYQLPPDVAKALDQKYDDGKYNSGDIVGNTDYDSATNTVDIIWNAF